jgi:hypothetical protein
MQQVLTMAFDPAAARSSTRHFTVEAAAARYQALFALLAGR